MWVFSTSGRVQHFSVGNVVRSFTRETLSYNENEFKSLEAIFGGSLDSRCWFKEVVKKLAGHDVLRSITSLVMLYSLKDEFFLLYLF